jgi:anti-sigma B factor antagonist
VKVSVETRDDATILQLHGQISIGSGVGELRTALFRLSGRGSALVVVDLDGVTFVDSAGLGELVAAHQRTWEQGGRLCVARPRAKVLDLIHLTRLHEVVPVHDDLDEALRAVAGDHSSSKV